MKTKLSKLLKPALLIGAVICCFYLSAQECKSKTGLIYVNGISWTENQKQDSIINIYIEGDTMEAIRNLLVYCLLIHDENNAAGLLLSTINLEQLQKIIDNNYYDIAFREYKKVSAKNEKYLDAK